MPTKDSSLVQKITGDALQHKMAYNSDGCKFLEYITDTNYSCCARSPPFLSSVFLFVNLFAMIWLAEEVFLAAESLKVFPILDMFACTIMYILCCALYQLHLQVLTSSYFGGDNYNLWGCKQRNFKGRID